MISAVFDTMTLLQAAANRKGTAGACLAFVEEGYVRSFVSAATLEEVHDVLHRPDIRKAFPNFDDDNVREFLDNLAAKSRKLEDVPCVQRLPRDPDDEPILNLAIAAQASHLVSRDNDLLDLNKNDAFRAAFPSLAIVAPREFLRQVRIAVAIELGYPEE